MLHRYIRMVITYGYAGYQQTERASSPWEEREMRGERDARLYDDAEAPFATYDTLQTKARLVANCDLFQRLVTVQHVP
jgi:hypothetical protein